MPTWKNPFVIAFASAGILVSYAFPPLTPAQTNEVLQSSPVKTSSAEQDDRWVESKKQEQTLPRQSSATQHATVHSPQFIEGQAQNVESAKRPVGGESPVPGQEIEPAAVGQSTAQAAIEMSDLIVNVETIPGSNGKFAVKLMVPDSVKIVEVTPVDSNNQARRLKIDLDHLSQPIGTQGRPNAQNGSNYSMPIAAPIRSASSLNSVVPPMQQNSTPVKQSPSPYGFQKNRFYKPASDRKPVPTTQAGNHPSTNNVTASKQISTVLLDDSNPQQASYDAESDSLELHALVQCSLQGPRQLELGNIGDFTVELHNPTTATITNVSVDLEVAQGLEVVLLDRPAEYDPKTKTLGWKVPELSPSQNHTIRYRVKSLLAGTQIQRTWIGSTDKPGQASSIDTVVSIDLESAEAPMLPFESN